MEIFNTQFVSAVMSCLLESTANAGSITRAALCDNLGISQDYVPVIAVLTDSPEFALFESVKRVGYRRVKFASLRSRIVAAVVAEEEDYAATVSESEPEVEIEAAPDPQSDAVPVADTDDYSEQETVRTSKPELKVIGTDGNAFALMSKASKVARQNGMDWDAILVELKSGDYSDLLATLCKYFDVQ